MRRVVRTVKLSCDVGPLISGGGVGTAAVAQVNGAGIMVRQFGATAPCRDQKSFRLLVVGGGTGGCSLASKFASKLGKGKVAVLEPNERHYYQPLWTLVGGGLKSFDESYRLMSKVLPSDCEWIQDRAVSFDPDNNTVHTANGDKIKYEFLVTALGLQLNFDAVRGCQEAIDSDPSVVSIYSYKYVQKAQPAIKNLKEGNAIFTFPSTPVKCAGAAQKILYLAEECVRDNGRRSSVNFMYNTFLPVIFPVTHYAAALDKLAASRGILVNKSRNLIEVRKDTKEAIFEIVGGEGQSKTETYKYSLLHVTPPMSSPRELWKSPLVDQANFVSVDKDTLQHTKYKNVFSIGDCGNAPTSKTAAAIASQLAIVGKNLSLVMEGKEPKLKYDGYTSCPFVVKKDAVMLAEFGYDGKILETFPFDQRIPRHSMFFLKAQIMPSIYWNLMLRGLWHGPSFFRKMWRFGL